MYIEQIQIRKDNKIAAMDPIAKLWVVLLYFVTNAVFAGISEPFGGYSPLLYAWFLAVIALAAATGIMKKFLKAMGVVATIFIIVFHDSICCGVIIISIRTTTCHKSTTKTNAHKHS